MWIKSQHSNLTKIPLMNEPHSNAFGRFYFQANVVAAAEQSHARFFRAISVQKNIHNVIHQHTGPISIPLPIDERQKISAQKSLAHAYGPVWKFGQRQEHGKKLSATHFINREFDIFEGCVPPSGSAILLGFAQFFSRLVRLVGLVPYWIVWL